MPEQTNPSLHQKRELAIEEVLSVKEKRGEYAGEISKLWQGLYSGLPPSYWVYQISRKPTICKDFGRYRHLMLGANPTSPSADEPFK